jgi:lipopolysaccharide transport system ATP-binding protein
MSDTVIKVENLSKQYVLGKKANAEGLRHAIHDLAYAPLRWLKSRNGAHSAHPERNGYPRVRENAPRDFWALKDVSFDIKQGEVVGIIGRNGAGKSTLLKILSRITEPTQGHIEITGRVASLLEVGTGFHPELTGRENVFLNGAILGMSRAEIKRKFEEIVAFAEVEKFLDTPVKRYSSGMYVRLAFSVAAHLEPEILIVDEVLAVGDTQFQQKCMEKIKAVGQSGRTVIFVSHNLSTVQNLCQTGILLEKGRFISKGDPSSVIGLYLASKENSTGLWTRTAAYPLSEGVFFERITFSAQENMPTAEFDTNQIIRININTTATRNFENVQIGINLINQEGITVFTTCNTDVEKRYVLIPQGRHNFSVEIPCGLLPQGRFFLLIISHVPQDRVLDLIDKTLSFFVNDVGSHATILKDHRPGVVTPLFAWEMQSLI